MDQADKVARVKALYKIICNGEIAELDRSVDLIKEISKLVGCDFSNSNEFHVKVNKFIGVDYQGKKKRGPKKRVGV